MKIVHICLAGPVTDGWNYQDNLLTKYQKKNGHDVTIITSQWIWGEDGNLIKNNLTNYVNEDGVKVYRLELLGKDDFSKKFKKYKNVEEIIIQEHPDVLFIHNVAFLDVKVIVKYCKNHPEVKVFVDNHSDFSNSATNWISKNILHGIIWKYFAKLLAPYATKFYGVLPARVNFLVDVYGLPKEKCDLLVMGADDELVENASKSESIQEIRKKYGIQPTDFLIMTGGKIDGWKTQTLLLMEAIKNIKDPRVKLIVFGSVVKDMEEKVIELSDGIKVQYIGWVEPRESYRYFASADLVVFPGRHSIFWEQVTGQGIPMICKSWDGTTHVNVGGNVKFYNQDSVDEISTVIQDLLASPNIYQSMLSVAQKQGMKSFSYQHIAEKSICKE